ncbi:hypothetical protein B0H21DRAFT_659601, partial [Amylocystis lapponica]
EEYPPLGYWLYESSEIEALWHGRLVVEESPDGRNTRHPMMKAEDDELSYIVQPDESIIFYDKYTNELVALVLRNFCLDGEVLAWADSVVAEATSLKRSVRIKIMMLFQLEDPGSLVLAGFSAGARSQPSFDWARNLLSKRHSPEFIHGLHHREASFFALQWNLMKARLPGEVMDDFEAFFERTGMCRMDTEQGKTAYGDYTIQKGEHLINFKHVEMAPPSGMFGGNYARATHLEPSPHKYAVSWNTSRAGGEDAGGHFYIARYGIKVIQTANTAIVWKPSQVHGTSLARWTPPKRSAREPQFGQRGAAIMTSIRLPRQWHRYQ